MSPIRLRPTTLILFAAGLLAADSPALALSARVTQVLQFGGIGNDAARGVAVDPNGNVYLVGTFERTVDFGGGPLTTVIYRDIFIAKFDQDLNHLWSRSIPGAANEDCFDVVAGATRVLLVGSFTGTMNFGAGNVVSAGGRDGYVLKLDASGNHVWSTTFGTVNHDAGYVVTLGPSSEIVVGGVQNEAGGTSSAILSRYLSDHSLQWTRSSGSAVHAVRIIPETGNMWVGLRAAANETYLQRYTTLGSRVDLRTNSVPTTIRGIALLDDDQVALAGDRSSRPFVVRDDATLSGSTGGVGSLGGLVLTPDDHTIAAGAFRSSAWGLHAHSDSTDAVVVSHRPSGSVRWVFSFGGVDDDAAHDIAMLPNGDAIVVGSFELAADFGGVQRISAGGSDIFVVRIETPTPTLYSLTDVGNDEGGFVKATIERNAFDYAGSPTPIIEYEVFRRDGATWTSARTMPAHAELFYYVIVPTIVDGVTSEFFVRAKTADPGVFWDSLPEFGTSLDNLAPAPPAQLLYQDGVVSWLASTAVDVMSYAVYGSDSNELRVTDEIIASTSETSVVVGSSKHAFYHVTAIDEAGNESESVHVAVSGDLPRAKAALQLTAYPNPFNPETTIRVELPASGHVVLAIYDARGARVALLADGVREAGPHTVAWQARDDDGTPVSSGVYFARLEFGGQTLVRKLLLIK